MSAGLGDRARQEILAASPRIAIQSPSLRGSLSLRGGRIDDVSLVRYRESFEPASSNVVLFSPAGAPDAYFADSGWLPAAGVDQRMPDNETIWTAETTGALTPTNPVVLTWANGQGLLFRRTITLDESYMFVVRDAVENRSGREIALLPFAVITRHGTPRIEDRYVSHEGLIAAIGDGSVVELRYAVLTGEIDRKAERNPNNAAAVRDFKGATGGWLGFTDKYWAAVIVPPQAVTYDARLWAHREAGRNYFKAEYQQRAMTIAHGATGTAESMLFVGAKEARAVDGYKVKLGITQFDLLIDWGAFRFLAEPLLKLLLGLTVALGDSGLALVCIAALAKLVTLPLATWSYYRLAEQVQQRASLTETYDGLDEARARRLARYDTWARRLAVSFQVPLMFAIYKILFATVELRQLPLLGSSADLSQPDPTNIFAPLTGLLTRIGFDPTAPPLLAPLLHLGAWAAVAGLLMGLQTRLTPTPADPTQRLIFNSVPVLVAYAMSQLPLGLAIYVVASIAISLAHQLLILWIYRATTGAKSPRPERMAAPRPTALSSDLPHSIDRPALPIPIALRAVRAARVISRFVFWIGAIAALVLAQLGSRDAIFLLPLVLAATLLSIVVYLAALYVGGRVAGRTFQAALASEDSRQWPIILYLRSFDIARSSLLARLTTELGYIVRGFFVTSINSLAGESSGSFSDRGRYEVEEHLGEAIGLNAMFVAIGDKVASYGAAKIKVGDAEWQKTFHRLAASARLIFMMPGPSDALLWELSELVRSPDLIAKSIFIMPRERAGYGYRDAWTKAASKAAEHGVTFPPYAASGCYFRLGSDGRPCERADLEAVTRALRAYLIRPPRVEAADFATILRTVQRPKFA
jgi:YidC/Oxa1 family membrane protein insertase